MGKKPVSLEAVVRRVLNIQNRLLEIQSGSAKSAGIVARQVAINVLADRNKSWMDMIRRLDALDERLKFIEQQVEGLDSKVYYMTRADNEKQQQCSKA